MSKTYGRKRPDREIFPVHFRGFRGSTQETRRNMEAVLPPKIFRIFSVDFQTVPGGKHRRLTGISRKKFRKFPVGILLPCSDDFL